MPHRTQAVVPTNPCGVRQRDRPHLDVVMQDGLHQGDPRRSQRCRGLARGHDRLQDAQDEPGVSNERRQCRNHGHQVQALLGLARPQHIMGLVLEGVPRRRARLRVRARGREAQGPRGLHERREGDVERKRLAAYLQLEVMMRARCCYLSAGVGHQEPGRGCHGHRHVRVDLAGLGLAGLGAAEHEHVAGVAHEGRLDVVLRDDAAAAGSVNEAILHSIQEVLDSPQDRRLGGQPHGEDRPLGGLLRHRAGPLRVPRQHLHLPPTRSQGLLGGLQLFAGGLEVTLRLPSR
mmetsp:Transcript_88615/g.286195  ORF Transcript_88615/g.286195 Transcript_88615/m.286195 type:complete len:290 (+) Transcript_88615:379-1248(+)